MSKPSNLFASLSNLLSSLLGIAQTRLELLANELEEQKAHLIKLFYYSMLMLFFFSVGLLLLTILLIIYFWEAYGLLALGLAAATYLVIALFFAVAIIIKLRNQPKSFSISLQEVSKDRAKLESL